jgi:hypothetical protein
MINHLNINPLYCLRFSGDFIVGNKMDTGNLATLFAPNILHALPPPSLRTQTQLVDSAALHAAERCDVINVIRTMIERHTDLFKVSPFHKLDLR